MNTYVLLPSNKKNKKWMVITHDGKKTIHFGNSNYEDMTMHGDESRKKLYLNRHRKNENWDNLNTAGCWSRWLLWQHNSLNKSIRDMEKRFKINILKFND